VIHIGPVTYWYGVSQKRNGSMVKEALVRHTVPYHPTSSPGWVPPRSDFGANLQTTYSIIWYQPKCSYALRLRR